MKALDLLNSEGPIIIAEWRGYAIYVVHKVHRYERRVTLREIESLVKGELTF